VNQLTVEQQRAVRQAADKRIKRALAHIKRLEGAVEDWMALDPIKPEGQISEDRCHFTMRVRIDPAPDLDDWGFTFGEALQQLRSTLDNLVTSLAAEYGVTDVQLRNVQFPVEFRTRRLKEAMTRVKLLPVEVQDVVRQAQPAFSAAQGQTDSPETYALSLLARFNNQDKHHLAISNGVQANQWDHSVQIEFEEPGFEFNPGGQAGGDLVAGGVLLEFDTAPHRIKQVKGGWRMKGSLTADLDGLEVSVFGSMPGIVADVSKVVLAVTTAVAIREWIGDHDPYCIFDLADLQATDHLWRCPVCGAEWTHDQVDEARSTHA
jgi:hypothetical protein